MAEPLSALLLSGGGGTRLWPLSTEQCPKQFLKLFGPQSLFQQTWVRAVASGASALLVMANQAQSGLIHDDLAELPDAAGRTRLIFEPVRRDSGPAIAAGVADCLARFGPKALVMVLACDHLIPDHAAFRETVALACDVARQSKLVTFGIRPTAPVSDYGYIRCGAHIAGTQAYQVAAFVEKPDRARAVAYLSEGNYLWNSGMFLFEAGVFAREAEQHMPHLWTRVQEAVGKGLQDGAGLTLDEAAFAASERISIDYALFEKSDTVAVIPTSFDWSDVGGWAAVHDALPQDGHGNATVSTDGGLVIQQDSQNTLLVSDGLPVLALGVEDLVVVATKDGVFVAPKSRAAEIKSLLARWPQT